MYIYDVYCMASRVRGLGNGFPLHQCILGVSRAVSGFPLRVCACRERESAHRVRYGTYVKREVHAGVHSQGTQVQQ